MAQNFCGLFASVRGGVFLVEFKFEATAGM